VSQATIRRDLDQLAQQQLVTRTRGGATAGHVSYDLPLRYKTGRHAAEKQRIGRAAAALVAPGAAVALNGGTTTSEVARALATRPDLQDGTGAPAVTVVTNAMNIANELAVRQHIKIVVTGGVTRGQSYELIGPYATLVLAELTLDWAILGVDGLDVRAGATAHHEGEASINNLMATINNLMATRAEQVMVVADSSKLGQRAFAGSLRPAGGRRAHRRHRDRGGLRPARRADRSAAARRAARRAQGHRPGPAARPGAFCHPGLMPEVAAPARSRLLAGGRVVTPAGVLSPGWIRLAGNLIEAVGSGPPPRQAPELPVTDLRGSWVLPGFVDMHVHGGGGTSFTEGSEDDARRAAAFHRGHGSTSIVASLVTAPLAELETRAARLAGLADAGVLAGLHLEGPFLSAARCGAQDARHLRGPDVAAFERLRAASAGYLRVITIAPELPGATALIAAAARAGVTVAVGHTDATAEVASAAVDAGATHATHLFNGMPPLHHREPGAAGALLDRDEVTCEVIADGVHLHDTTIRLVARAAGPGRLVLITDAMAAAGRPDGSYRLGSMRVDVSGGVARLAERGGSGPIAGSTATMDVIVRRAVAAGLPVPEAAAAASTNPARVLGLQDRVGALRPGLAADLVVCDDDFRLSAVMAGGQWLAQAPPTRYGQPGLRTDPVRFPVDELTSHTTVRSPACQAAWFG
jgi:N-acetylglucosamine-6-phosphate deacetylase